MGASNRSLEREEGAEERWHRGPLFRSYKAYQNRDTGHTHYEGSVLSVTTMVPYYITKCIARRVHT